MPRNTVGPSTAECPSLSGSGNSTDGDGEGSSRERGIQLGAVDADVWVAGRGGERMWPLALFVPTTTEVPVVRQLGSGRSTEA